LNGRKVGGVLCEAVTERGGPGFVVGGIGVNIAGGGEEWPPELASTAITLETAAAVDPARVAGAVVREWLGVARRPDGPLSVAELEEYRRRDVLRGRAVTVDGRLAGVAEGPDPAGALRIHGGEGVHHVVGGTVRPFHPDPGGER
ncbi:MAG: hypothetical protein GWM90_31630, partial [Gemmatimonadetes bacterium]|nr:hypothetical protein [Gemmatimonadota bacterium]NIX48444.1 hypothetical protein [Gemmatimonadota bacterium]